ncbi:MAG: VOC family protein [Candidatus Eremiobacteraeota bacterium]|nr:VOC family protein [Candidatus Eremiobacteraeota bacterium]
MSTPRRLLSHIDLRVRDRARSAAFYDQLLGVLGLSRRDTEDWTSYFDASNKPAGPDEVAWFGFTQDEAVLPNANRIAFLAASNEEVDRVAEILRQIDASNIEGPNYDEGPAYYAVFFGDPDGHLLEVCCRVI